MMDSGSFPTVASSGASTRPRHKPIPDRVERALCHLEWSPTLEGLAELERELAGTLGLDAALCVWFDWCVWRAWSPHGPVSPRVAELVHEATGRGWRVVCDNAVVEPIGPAPAAAAIVAKGSPERLFLPHVLRTLTRVAERLARVVPAIARAPRAS
jgi:hypothetical protein